MTQWSAPRVAVAFAELAGLVAVVLDYLVWRV